MPNFKFKTRSVSVTTAGTPVRLSQESLLVSSLEVFAKDTNSGDVYIGDEDVDSATGRPIVAGASFAFAGDELRGNAQEVDLYHVWVDAENNGSQIIITYPVRIN